MVSVAFRPFLNASLINNRSSLAVSESNLQYLYPAKPEDFSSEYIEANLSDPEDDFEMEESTADDFKMALIDEEANFVILQMDETFLPKMDSSPMEAYSPQSGPEIYPLAQWHTCLWEGIVKPPRTFYRSQMHIINWNVAYAADGGVGIAPNRKIEHDTFIDNEIGDALRSAKAKFGKAHFKESYNRVLNTSKKIDDEWEKYLAEEVRRRSILEAGED